MSSHESFSQQPFQTLSDIALPTSSPFTLKESQIGQSRAATSIVFVDSQVEDYRSLVAGVQDRAEVHVLNSSQDTLAQITQTLLGRSQISSVHILSHGAAGGLRLGERWLMRSDLDSPSGELQSNRYSTELQSWSKSLTEDADLLLYGCDVAAGEQGQVFVQQLAQLTGADVAASDDLTGNSSLGGDWNLEYRTGAIEAVEVLGQTAMSQYSQTLGDIIINEVKRVSPGAFISEAIEFLLTADLTATQLQSLFFGDSNGTTSNKSGVYQFKDLSSIATTFKAGTVIVVGGSNVVPVEDTTYSPLVGGTDDQWNIALKFGGSYASFVSGTGDFSASQDAAWVDTSSSGITSTHSIAYKATGSFGAFGNAATIKLNATNADPIIQFNGNGSQTTDSTKFAFAPSGTLGSPNGGENSTYIASLRNPNAPLTAQASSVTLDEDSTYSFQASDFRFSTSSGQTLQQVQVTQLPVIGQLFLDADSNNTQDTGEAVTANQIITLADIPKLKFQPVANASGFKYDYFNFKVSDGQAFSTEHTFMTLNVNSVNDAPVLDTSSSPTLPSIYENASNPTGISISALIGTSITDVDFGAVSAIALVGADNTNGMWQFSTNGGTTWTNLGTVSDSSATVLGATSLYTATLGNAPASQGWLAFANVPGGATQSVDRGGTTLNTSASNSIYAGYSNYNGSTLVNPNFPTLDRTTGYTLSFDLKLDFESHTNINRAGFSAIVLSNDKRGIELGFQQLSPTTGTIFAQSDDITPNPGGQPNGLFVAAESVSFNTNQATSYSLHIKGDTYQLLANGVQILTGVLRDYKNFVGSIDPYETPNFIFLGDDTTSAKASFTLGHVALQPETRVRFVPNADFAGNAAFSFRAWDITNGAANGTTGVNTSVNGGASAFSSGVETAAIAINALPKLSISHVSQVEGDKGRTTYTFTVSLSEASAEPISVDYTTADGTATVTDNDYLAQSGRLTFAVGETSKTIAIQVNGDSKFEPNETFFVNLVNAMNAAIAVNTGTATIVDDDNANWTIAGEADFDGDGKVDLLWRNYSNGQNVIWKMNGTSRESVAALSTVNTNYRIEGIADFDGDGKVDLLWRNYSNGQNVIWKMNGTSRESVAALSTVNTNYHIEDIADFDGDGKVDILWRNYSNGQNVIWKMNGISYDSSIALPSVSDASWKVESIADFDGDGKVDILWRNYSNGQNVIWKMNGISYDSSIALPSVSDASWKVESIADFDGDGKVDILWRNYSNGQNIVWKMNGISYDSSIALPTIVDVNWKAEGTADFDGDGKVDILWRNHSTGWNVIWRMDGTGYLNSITLPTA